MESFGDLILRMVGVIAAERMLTLLLTSITVAIVTVGVIDMFMMQPRKPQKMDMPTLDKREMISYFIAIGVIGAAIIACINIFGATVSGNSHFSFSLFVVCAAVIAICGLLGSIALRAYLTDEEKVRTKGEYFLLTTALIIIGEKLVDRLIAILKSLIANIWYIFTKLTYRQMILQYGLISMLINLTFSFILVGMMGASKESAAANLIGSSIAAIVHYLMRKNQITELRAKHARGEDIEGGDK